MLGNPQTATPFANSVPTGSPSRTCALNNEGECGQLYATKKQKQSIPCEISPILQRVYISYKISQMKNGPLA